MMSYQTMALFSNDATEVRYTDGSRLQLSPCGASFTFWNSPSSNHNNQAPRLLSNKSIQQRTRYAVSDYKMRVLQALEFRNQFAVHPYLCTDIIDKQCLVHIYSDIQEVSWPASHTNADIKKLPDGNIQISSIDQCASLKLSNTRQQFSVEFLCKVPREGNKKTHNIKGETHDKDVQQKCQSQNALPQTTQCEKKYEANHSASHGKVSDHAEADLRKSAMESGMSLQNKPVDNGNAKSEQTLKDLSHNTPAGGCVYVWVVQHYSVDGCPLYWRHPLQLAMRIPQMSQETQLEEDSSAPQQRNEVHGKSWVQPANIKRKDVNLVHTQLPSALPINCPSSHMHSWKDTKISLQDALQDTYALEMEYASNGGIQVLMVNGVIYRLLSGGSPRIEIYPGDNSVIKSSHLPGGITHGTFFIHHIATPDGSMEEKMYSTSNLPPDRPACSYSLASVLARASRLLQMHLCHSDVASSLPCWKISHQQGTNLPQSQIPSVLLEEKHILDVGRFSAYSDGYIRIAFPDRTVLDWRCDLSPCIDRYWLRNKGGTQKDCNPANQQSRVPPSDTCQLLLPNGQYVLVDVQQPAVEYHRYIAMAEEWRTWVNLEPNERTEFYQQQFINDPNRVVHDELQKIQNFTYITETIPTYQPQQFDIKDTSGGNKEQRSTSEYHQEADDSHRQEIATNSEISLEMIKEALSKTSQAISSIETLLEH
ncbi:uncharacterized protein C5orf34 homolog isoform X2 [Amphiura filiformis]|uniref:uncharacterized protein C5orf34 homolog isoform X2 n=1 Tax=Amphiura filiformis TaxID=82378 RepID=UPI003B2146CF